MHHTVQSMKHDHYGCITAIHVPSNDVILLFVGSLGTNDCSREDFSKLVCFLSKEIQKKLDQPGI